MAIESSGHSRGNPRMYELIENAPKTGGTSPTIWAWPAIVAISTSVMASSFSVLMTALFHVSGIAPPV